MRWKHVQTWMISFHSCVVLGTSTPSDFRFRNEALPSPAEVMVLVGPSPSLFLESLSSTGIGLPNIQYHKALALVKSIKSTGKRCQIGKQIGPKQMIISYLEVQCMRTVKYRGTQALAKRTKECLEGMTPESAHAIFYGQNKFTGPTS